MFFLNASPAEIHSCLLSGTFGSIITLPRITESDLPQPGSILPANSLNVIIFCHRQFMAALGAASLQNFAAIRGFHALAKAMNTDATAHSRLVGPFGHSKSSQNLSIVNLTVLDYTATMGTGQRFLLIFNP